MRELSTLRDKLVLVSWTGLCVLTLCCQLIVGGSPQNSSQAQEIAARGLQLAQQGDLKGAEAELRRAVELGPQDPFCLSSLGSILGMQQKLEESNLYLQKALKIDPHDSVARRNLASNQFQLGQLKPAKDNLESVLKARPSDTTAILLLGMVAEELKDYSRAAKLLSSVPDQVRQRPESIAALARSYYHTNQKEKAGETLKILQEHPAGPEGVFLGGQAATEAEDYATAEQMFNSIWSAYPDTAKLGYSLALVQYRSNRIDAAQATLRQLLDAGRESSDIYNLQSWCFHKQGKLKEAVRAMDQAIDLDPRRETNYLDLGKILIEHKRYSVALEAAKKAIEVAPGSYQAYQLKGNAESNLSLFSEAVKSYQRAVELNPNSSDAILTLALAQSAEGLTEEAVATFEKGIKRFPQDPKLYQAFGRTLLIPDSGSDAAAESRAVTLLEKALSLDDSLPESHFELGALALKKGNMESALRHLRRAAQLDPTNSKVHYVLSRAYRRLGRNEEVAKELQIYEELEKKEDKSNQRTTTGEMSRGTKQE